MKIPAYIFFDTQKGNDWNEFENEEADYSFEWQEAISPTDAQLRQKALKLLRRESSMKGDVFVVIKFQSRFIPFCWHASETAQN